MFIKITLICLAFVPLIIGRVSGIPTRQSTRVGKLLGWFAGGNDHEATSKVLSRKWIFTLERGPFMASVELNRYIDFRDWQKQQHGNAPIENSVELQSDLTSITSNDLDPSTSNDTETLASEDNATTNIPLDSTEETTQVAPSTFQLKDCDVTTFDPDVEANRVRRDSSLGKNHEQRDEDDSDDDAESTTVESSTKRPLLQAQTDSQNHSDFHLQPAAVASSHQNFYYIPSLSFPYPPSKNPSAEFVSITQSPPSHETRRFPHFKSYYDFYPSQVDYSYHSSNPHCNNFDHQRLNPVVHDSTWFNYRNWNSGNRV